MGGVHFVIGFLCVGVTVTLSEIGTYRAGVLENLGGNWKINDYANYIRKAGKLDVDILMLPSIQGLASYDDEMIKSISESVKEAALYVVAPLAQKLKCDNEYQLFVNSVVFDRNGDVLSIFRKPESNIKKCNSTQDSVSFKTDFGVSFKHVAVQDFVLNHPDAFVEVRNLIVSGDWSPELMFFTSNQYFSAWSQTVGVNLLFDSTIYSQKQVKGISLDNTTTLYSVQMEKEPKSGQISLPVPSYSSKIHLDLSQFTLKSLDLEVSNRGIKETVCQDEFCCNFYIKTSGMGAKNVYSLAVFNGVRNFGSQHYVGIQYCAVIACDRLYNSACVFASKNTTLDTIFEELSISGNFSKANSLQLPLAFKSDFLSIRLKDYSFDSESANQITVKLSKPSELMTFGILGRDFSMDFESSKTEGNNSSLDINEDLNELFDYIWIRLRVIIFVVSIYVLEMM